MVAAIATKAFPRTSYAQLYSRRLPSLAVWASGLTVFFGWPHVARTVRNTSRDASNSNYTMFLHHI